MSHITSTNITSAARYAKDGSTRTMAEMLVPEIETATAAAGGAATCHALAGRVTSASLTEAQNAIFTLTVTNNLVAAGDMVFVSVRNGSNTQGTPMVGRVQPAAGSFVALVINKHASAEALNGTLVVDFKVFKAGAA